MRALVGNCLVGIVLVSCGGKDFTQRQQGRPVSESPGAAAAGSSTANEGGFGQGGFGQGGFGQGGLGQGGFGQGGFGQGGMSSNGFTAGAIPTCEGFRRVLEQMRAELIGGPDAGSMCSPCFHSACGPEPANPPCSAATNACIQRHCLCTRDVFGDSCAQDEYPSDVCACLAACIPGDGGACYASWNQHATCIGKACATACQ
jgi:hypothetical protein